MSVLARAGAGPLSAAARAGRRSLSPGPVAVETADAPSSAGGSWGALGWRQESGLRREIAVRSRAAGVLRPGVRFPGFGRG